ncbi:MAG: hypothetical protein ACR2PS_11835, partial [Pseudomonadales bacterium]
PLFQLLPAGTILAGWDSHPLSERTFARRTENCGLAIRGPPVGRFDLHQCITAVHGVSIVSTNSQPAGA